MYWLQYILVATAFAFVVTVFLEILERLITQGVQRLRYHWEVYKFFRATCPRELLEQADGTHLVPMWLHFVCSTGVYEAFNIQYPNGRFK